MPERAQLGKRLLPNPKTQVPIPYSLWTFIVIVYCFVRITERKNRRAISWSITSVLILMVISMSTKEPSLCQSQVDFRLLMSHLVSNWRYLGIRKFLKSKLSLGVCLPLRLPWHLWCKDKSKFLLFLSAASVSWIVCNPKLTFYFRIKV